MGSEAGYKDKSAASRLAAAWGYTRRTGLSSSVKAHWASKRGKKLLLGVFVYVSDRYPCHACHMAVVGRVTMTG